MWDLRPLASLASFCLSVVIPTVAIFAYGAATSTKLQNDITPNFAPKTEKLGSMHFQ